MARDLSFWKCKENIALEDKEIYSLLLKGESIQGIEFLPIDRILLDVKHHFWDWISKDNIYEKGDESFEITYTEHFFRFDCYSMSECNMNKIIDIMYEYDCPLYDSAIDIRFDE